MRGIANRTGVRPWKYILIAAGLAGTIAIFMPLLTIKKGFFEQGFSARDLVINGENTRHTLAGKLPQIATAHLPKALQPLRSDVDDALLGARAMSAIFIPALLLLGLGFFAAYRGTCGRRIGAFALLCSIGSIAGWVALRWGLREYGTSSLRIEVGSAGAMLWVVGGLGLVAAVGALLKPDRGAITGSAVS
ncbi:MAG: hypothetical protein KBG15_10905 [Kofleriaceae bacterium]|nr:hypothetical protein [Kofleriaceae bacterium]